MWKKIEKFLLQQSSDFVGIDIGTGAIKLVEVAWKKEKPVLKNFGIQTLPHNVLEDGLIIDRQRITEALGKLLKRTHTESKQVVVSVGGRIMFARELMFPAMTMEELGEAIKWDLEKYIPYAPNTYYFDFAIVGEGNTSTEIKVLLVASPLDHVTHLIEIIKSVGLKLVAIDIEPLALYRIFDDADQAMVIDIGAFLSQVTLFYKGSPAVIRNMPIGGQNFTKIIMETLDVEQIEAETIKLKYDFLGSVDLPPEYIEVKQQFDFLVEEFVRDVRRTAEYFQQQNRDVTIQKVFLIGGGAKLRNLVPTLSDLLGMPIFTYDPLSKLEIPTSFDRAHLEQVAFQLGTAVGLALRGGDA